MSISSIGGSDHALSLRHAAQAAATAPGSQTGATGQAGATGQSAAAKDTDGDHDGSVTASDAGSRAASKSLLNTLA